MKKLILFLAIIGIVFVSSGNVQENQSTTLSTEAINSLQSNGFSFLDMHYPVRSPRMLDSTNLPQTAQIKMSMNVQNIKNLKVTKSDQKPMAPMIMIQDDTIFINDLVDLIQFSHNNYYI